MSMNIFLYPPLYLHAFTLTWHTSLTCQNELMLDTSLVGLLSSLPFQLFLPSPLSAGMFWPWQDILPRPVIMTWCNSRCPPFLPSISSTLPCNLCLGTSSIIAMQYSLLHYIIASVKKLHMNVTPVSLAHRDPTDNNEGQWVCEAKSKQTR